jgi:hypothetical protein
MYQSDGSMDGFDKILASQIASLSDTEDLTVKDADKYTYDLFGNYDTSFDNLTTVSTSHTSISSLTSMHVAALTTSQIAPLTPSSLNTWTLPKSNTGIYTVSVGGTGGSGGILGPSNVTINNGAGYNNSWATGKFKITGDAEFDGDVKIKGESMTDLLKNIQDKLAIFKPNPELEEKWENLRELARQYKELEADIKEKELIWETLRK